MATLSVLPTGLQLAPKKVMQSDWQTVPQKEPRMATLLAMPTELPWVLLKATQLG